MKSAGLLFPPSYFCNNLSRKCHIVVIWHQVMVMDRAPGDGPASMASTFDCVTGTDRRSSGRAALAAAAIAGAAGSFDA